MSTVDDADGQSNAGHPPQGRAQVTIVLPDTLSNMVFIEAGPLWLCVILGAVGVVVGGVLGLAGSGREGLALMAVSAAGATVGVVGLLIGWYVLWRRAVRGYRAEIIVLYVSYLLGIILGPPLAGMMAAFVFLPIILQSSDTGGEGGWPVVVILGIVVVAGLVWLLALTNLFERRLWEFAQLDGRCPLCRRWRFGRIRQPGTIVCEECGAVLEFVCPDQHEGPS
jgi:hypothetical protein